MNKFKNKFNINIGNWRNYTFEFLSIFIAVVAAFGLDNWNDNRKDRAAEIKILSEISNGLEEDIVDVNGNAGGHEEGLESVQYWRDILNKKPRRLDSIQRYYHVLLRDFVSNQNISGYETLKSKGLELIQNDSLRYKIIALYEYDYNFLRKLEEEYIEMQFFKSYFEQVNTLLSPHFIFDEKGMIFDLELPLDIGPNEQRKLMSYLWKIQTNRNFILKYYSAVRSNIIALKVLIDQEISLN